MNKQKNKKSEKIIVKVSKTGSFKIPTQIKKLHEIEMMELEIQNNLIVLKQLKQESEV